MTLNCPVDNQGKPLALSQQIFFLYRPHIDFQINIQGVGKIKSKGIGFLTTFRLIFIPNQPSKYFISFDIPIHLLYNEGTEFPIFGVTYLYGSSQPYQNLLPGKSHFKLWFNQGGCDTFIKLLDKLIRQNRISRRKNVAFQNTNFYQDLRSGKFNFNAFVNPNDPSKIVTQQKRN